MTAARCTATTLHGRPCRNRPYAGTERCYVHRQVLDEEAVSQLIAFLRAGNYLEVAAAASRVDVDLLPPELVDRMVAARAEGEALAIARIAQAAGENWQAAAWLLERQHPDRWARPATRPAEDSASSLVPTDDWLDELAGRRAARRAQARS